MSNNSIVSICYCNKDGHITICGTSIVLTIGTDALFYINNVPHRIIVLPNLMAPSSQCGDSNHVIDLVNAPITYLHICSNINSSNVDILLNDSKQNNFILKLDYGASVHLRKQNKK